MVKIGILACQNTSEITDALILILKNSDKSVAIKSSLSEYINTAGFYDYSEIDYLLITIEPGHICPCTLDILILDNPVNKRIVTRDLIQCIDDDTILIYNTDNGYLPKIEHPNAIDYGFSPKSTVSVSSVKYDSGMSCSFIVSVQDNFRCLSGKSYPIGEILISCNSDIKLENRLPAVICGLVLGSTERNEIKI